MADRHVYEMATTCTLVSPDILIYDPGYIRDDSRSRIRALFRVFRKYCDNPTDNAEVDPNGLRVWGENGRLHIQTRVMDTACIVTFEGRLYRNLSLPVGETITSVPQGSYIIYIGNQSYKIRF